MQLNRKSHIIFNKLQKQMFLERHYVYENLSPPVHNIFLIFNTTTKFGVSAS